MRRRKGNSMRLFALLIGLALAGCGQGPPAPAVSDSERLQGTWTIVKQERGGVAVLAGETAGATVIFKTGCVVVRDSGGRLALFERFTLEPHHDPHRIIIHEDPPPWAAKDAAATNAGKGEKNENDKPEWKERKIVGIYRFEKDGRLTLCFIRGSDSPPKSFTGKSRRDSVLMVLEKVKE